MSVVTNQQLFSHTYLAQLQADPSYDEAAARIAQGLRDWLPSRDTSSLPSLIETWVGPVLDFLQFYHVPADDSSHVHLLYARRGDETPIGLCYVVPPGQGGSAGSPRGLDDTTRGRHPMAQAVLALRARSLRWGILTDGTRWRLVDAQSLRRYEHYLEIDLDALARTDDPAPLRLFYALFHRSASSPSPSQGEGRVGVRLDDRLAASERATKRAEDHLKARVSHNEGIMAQLCLGLVRADGAAHGERRYTEAERDAIYRDATYLLYRMLFILYAEARGLLPVDEPAYRAVSLAGLVQTARDYKLHVMHDPQATTLWERLRRLCHAIYESDPELGIPAYDGGLFDDADKPYLREGHVADAYLTEALFDLAYILDKVPGTSCHPIDYRDLSVRHLGSLYEGMIEYKLQIAEETLWARRDGKGNLRFLRTGQDGAPRKTDEEIKPGSVYFSQSPGERRATGTYYTPEYIVDYIVRQTVVRGMEERRAALEEKLSGWREEIAAVQTSEVSALQRTADEELLRFVEEQVLTFRVCDPGMGSGHFLVNAAHQITDFIVETLHLAPWPRPLTASAGPQSSGLCIDADPVAWRRRVVEHCLYGVDLSLMAVELAKLSLWLASVAEGKPLSFLDHHLRQGNSLIGARLEDLAEVLAGVVSTKPSRQERKAREAGQLSMLDDPAFSQHVTAATDLLAQISARVAGTVEDVKVQEADYEQVRAELESYRQLANLMVARHFGMEVDEQQLRDISRYLANGAIGPVPEYQHLLNETQRLATERHFFHWELEFPQIFFAEYSQLLGKPGFDAAVGNPPYVSNWELTAYDSSLPKALETFYPEASTGHWDLYVMFIYRALSLLNVSGLHSFIVPSSLATERYGTGIRKHMLTKRHLLALVDFGEHLVFENVSRHYLVYLVSIRDRPRQEIKLCRYVNGTFAETGEIEQGVFLNLSNYSFRTDLQKLDIEVKCKVEEIGAPLGTLCCVNPGVVAHSRADSPITFRKDDVIGSEKLDEGYKRYVRGEDVGRWMVQWSGLYMDYESKRQYFHRPKFPELFESPKIMVRGVSGANNTIVSVYDPDGYYTNHSLFHAVSWTSRFQELQSPAAYEIDPNSEKYDLRYIASLVNSTVINHYFSKFLATGTLQGSYSGVYPEDGRKFPIRRVNFTTSAEQRAALVKESSKLYTRCMREQSFQWALEFVEHHLSQVPEESDVVHDLLVYLAQQMTDLDKERQRLEREADLFRFVERDTPCPRLDKAMGVPLSAGEMVSDLSAVRHDIEGLHLTQEEDGRWLLEVRVKLRAPESGWREHQRDQDGNFIRRWLPAYRFPLDETTGRFYHYAFAHRDGFDGAGKFPGGFTRTTLEKLNATKVPRFVPVDLAPLATLEAELAEVQRKTRLTDDLIDQIVYKLYGLTEEEIAIVEGRGINGE